MTRIMKRYPAYKESGIEWLGEIPLQWEMVKLRHIANLINEKAEGSSSDNNLQIALENIEGFTGRLISRGEFGGAGNRFEKGDVLFNKLRPYLCKAVIAPENGTAVGELLVLRPTNQLNNRFLLYRLLSDDFISIVDGSTYGAKMPRASWEFIGNLKIPAPSLAEQQAIADYLDRKTAVIDSLIAKKERQIELLQEQRTGVINQAVTRGLDPQVPLKESGIPWLGRIPSHWETGKFQYVTTLVQTGPFGSQLHFSDYVENEIPIINPSNIQDTQIIPDWARCISQKTLKRLNRHKLSEGDIVFARRGEMGRCALVTAVEDGWLCGTGSIKLCLDRSKAYPPYIIALLSNQGVREWLELESVGSTMANLNTEIISRIPIPLIPVEEQKSIVAFVEDKQAKFDRLVEINVQLIEKLQEYRTAVISAAVTGKIDVRDL